jgi:hypothetical protein
VQIEPCTPGRGSREGSDVEEDGLVLALQVDVEPIDGSAVVEATVDQRVLQRPPELVVDVAVDNDALAGRHSVPDVVADQVVVERAKLVGAKDRRSDLGERLLQRDQRELRAARDARLVRQ